MQYDEGGNQLRIARLSDRGVGIWGADRVYVAEDVVLDQIETGAEIYSGHISGAETRIGKGTKIGVSGPARITNCQIGRDCSIGAGVYDDATLLDNVEIRGFAELRGGTLLEEYCSAAHSVAFKNTILTANCVVGSLINYCDIFMSGGPSREDHSEVGSGAIHFNFDPRGDKWGSVVGGVEGVLLRAAPVFVGGQVGLVGPLSIGFGAVVAAGSVVRRDVEGECVAFSPAAEQTRTLDGFDRRIYGSVASKLAATARVVGVYHALDAWYEQVREPSAAADEAPLYAAARVQIRRNIEERAKRIDKLIGKLGRSIERSADTPQREQLHEQHGRLIERRKGVRASLAQGVEGKEAPEAAVASYRTAREQSSHLEAVRELSETDAEALAHWLKGVACVPLERLGKEIEFR